jgi:hypothetical protein
MATRRWNSQYTSTTKSLFHTIMPETYKGKNELLLGLGAMNSLAEEIVADHSRILLSSEDEGKDDSCSADPGSISTDDVDSSTGNSTKGGSSALDFEVELKRNVLREEEKNVRRARLLVGISFLACAAAITGVVYFLTKQSDQSAFETEV